MQGNGDRLDRWIARLREIPDAERTFTVGPEQAEREFGFDRDAVRELIARGLPHAEGEADGARDAGPLLWVSDVQYLGLRLGRARVYQGVLNRWASALTSLSARAETPVAIRCRAYAAPGTAVELRTPGGERVSGEAGAMLGFETTMRGQLPPLPPAQERALAPLLADYASYDFCWLWPPLETDLAWVRRTRIANCRAAAGLLVEEAPALGIEARLAYGLLLAPPYSTPHNWAEVRTDDGWVALDPLLLALLSRFAGLDAAAWPPTRSPGAILLRLADPGTPLVIDADSGAPLEATFLTKPLVQA